MARPRAKLDVSGQAALVAERLATEPAGPLRERLLAVKAGLEGELTHEEIAASLRRSRRTVEAWLGLYREGGLEALAPKAGEKRGPKHGLDARADKELRKKLARGSFRTGGQAREWLESRFGIRRSERTVRRWMGKSGAGLKVVRPRHPGSSERAREQFKGSLARLALRALRRKLPRKGPRRPVRVWTADEGRFGLHPCHRRAWTMRGVRAHRDSSRRYRWSYVWAALQVGGGGSEFLYSGSVDKEVCACFLRQISERDPLAVHVVVWDGAGFHPGEDDALVPENVVLLRLPPYSPELNPVERLWDMLRDELCNRAWKGLDELMAAATRWLEGFWSDGRRVLSLVGGGWLLVQVNACSGSCLGSEL